MITLEEITIIAAPVSRCFDLARSVEVHLAGNRHFGEQAVALEGATSGLLKLSDTVTWRARHLGVRQNLTSQITAFESPCYFQDTMLRGAFKSMRHDHYFRAFPPGSYPCGAGAHTEMCDVFRFSASYGVLGHIAEDVFLGRYMLSLLRERNRMIKLIAESCDDWQQYMAPAGTGAGNGRAGGFVATW